MAIVVLPALGADPVTLTGPVLDGKVDPLATDYNGNIDNTNIASAAGIVYSKLSLTGNVVYADLSATAFAAITQPVNWKKGADIASATPDIGAATGNSCDVTGTTTITALGTIQAGTVRLVRFTGILTLTHNGTSLILPTGANITTAAGDSAIFLSLGSGNWRCENYQRKDGSALLASATSLTGIVPTVSLETVALTDYSATSTIVGWTSFTTKILSYKKIGKSVWVTFDLEGTSNSTSVTFTVANAAAASCGAGGICYFAMDNSANLSTPCRYSISANTSTVTVVSDIITGAWTNSGTKKVFGSFWYEAAA